MILASRDYVFHANKNGAKDEISCDETPQMENSEELWWALLVSKNLKLLDYLSRYIFIGFTTLIVNNRDSQLNCMEVSEEC